MADEKNTPAAELSEFENPFVGGDGQIDEGDDAVDRGDSLEPVTPEKDEGEEEVTPEDLEKEGEEEAEPEAEPEAEEEAEPEAEEEAEEAEPEAEEEAEPEEKPKGQTRIPKERFDQVNDRMKRAEAKLKAIEEAEAKAAETAGKDEFDFDTKEKEYQDAVLDGETDKAIAIRKEIRAAEQEMFEAAADAKIAKGETAVQIKLRISDSVSDMQTRYAELNEDSEHYNADMVEEILDLQAGYIQRGYDPVQALEKGRDVVVKMNDLMDVTAKATTDDAEDPEVEKPAKEVAKRKTDVKKNLAAAKAQPARMQGGENGGEDRSAQMEDDMSEEEFDALPESKKRQLRGDTL